MVLVKSENLGQVLAQVYQYRKNSDSKFSLQYICHRAGIPSKGHLADVMAQRRTLKLEYAKPISKVFEMNQHQSKIFILMARLEKARAPSERVKLEHKLKLAKKSLQSIEADYLPVQGNPVDFSRVFCSLGIIKKPVTPKKISQALAMKLSEVEDYLAQLVARGFLKEKPKGEFELSNTDVHFNRGFFVEMVKAYILRAEKSVEHWIQSEESFFESNTVSVSWEKYQKILPELKEFFVEKMTDLESETGNRLIHFNVQIYPDKKTKV